MRLGDFIRPSIVCTKYVVGERASERTIKVCARIKGRERHLSKLEVVDVPFARVPRPKMGQGSGARGPGARGKTDRGSATFSQSVEQC